VQLFNFLTPLFGTEREEVAEEQVVPEAKNAKRQTTAFLNAQGQAIFRFTINAYSNAFDPAIVNLILQAQLQITTGGLNANRLTVGNIIQTSGNNNLVTGMSGLILLADGVTYAGSDVVVYILINATSVAGPDGESVGWASGTTNFPILVNVLGSHGIFSAAAQITGLSGGAVNVVGRKKGAGGNVDEVVSKTLTISSNVGKLFEVQMVQA